MPLLPPDDEHPPDDPGWEKHFAGCERMKVAARIGATSGEAHEQLLLELIRARDLWPEQPREALLGYIDAFIGFLEWIDRPQYLDP